MRHFAMRTLPFLIACTLTGCAKPPQAATPQGRRLSDGEMQRVVDITAWARKLDVKRPVRIERLQRPAFLRALADRTHSEDATEQGTDTTHALLGFNLLPPPEGLARVSKVDDLLAEQVAGFYDRKADRVFLPDVRLKSFEQEVEHRAVLSHEVHHALQAQHFDVGSLMDVEGEDLALARLAVMEGDAMVTMAAYFGADYGKPIHRTVRTISDVTEKVSMQSLADRDSELANALPLTRESLLFPYDKGMMFVSDIFRTGGFELVNQLYETPPQSTAQILHPETYLAGVQPAEIATVDLPPPFELSSRGRLGELRTSVTLAQCHEPEAAREAASGWRGDVYQVGRDASGATAVMWTTLMDTEAHAEAFAKALAHSPDCWKANRVGTVSIAAGAHVARSGKLVAVVRGLPADTSEEVAQAMLAADVTVPEDTPVSDLALPPREPLPEYVPGAVAGDVYTSEWLGIEGRIPAGMMVSVGKTEGDLELEVKRDSRSYAALYVSDRITDKRYVDFVFEDIMKAVRGVIDPSRLTVPVTTSGRGPLGKGIVRSWTLIGTNIDMRAILIPICNGTGSLVFVQMFADDHSREVMDGWLASFRWRDPKRTPPACKRLDPR